MTHLTPEEIELFSAGDQAFGEDSTHRGSDARVRHLARCESCREEVEALRALVRCLKELPQESPRTSIADAVMGRVELPVLWLEERLAQLPEPELAAGFAASVMDRVDLPVPWLDEALAALPDVQPGAGFAAAAMERVNLEIPWLETALGSVPQVAPDPGFATAVMSRVRLPIPWHQRIWRFARRRKVALAGAGASTVAVSAAGAGWLFGVQGVTPVQFIAYLLGGLGDLAMRGLMALGGIGYELGLVDAGTTLTDISPLAALGSLALASVVGLTSLFVMARLMRTGPELRLSRTT